MVGLWVGFLGWFVWVGLVRLWVELINFAKEGGNSLNHGWVKFGLGCGFVHLGWVVG